MIVCGWCDTRPALFYFAFLVEGRGRKITEERLYVCVRCRPSLKRAVDFNGREGRWAPESTEVVA